MASSEIVQWRGSGKAVFWRKKVSSTYRDGFPSQQAFKETTKAIDIEMERAVLRDDTGARTSNLHGLEIRYC